jgi:hypothetical protein
MGGAGIGNGRNGRACASCDEPVYAVKDESDLILLGFLAFLDPPKDAAAEALKRLHGLNRFRSAAAAVLGAAGGHVGLLRRPDAASEILVLSPFRRMTESGKRPQIPDA